MVIGNPQTPRQIVNPKYCRAYIKVKYLREK